MDAVTIYIGLILLLDIIFAGSVLGVLAHALKKTGKSLKAVFVVGIIFLLWLIGITFLNFTKGVYTKELLLGIGIPVLLGVLLLLWKPYREVIKAIPQRHYMKLQALRIFFGIVLLLEVFIGDLPSWFRNLAGGGDIAAGIAGLLAFFLITRFGVIKWQVITANIIGILDRGHAGLVLGRIDRGDDRRLSGSAGQRKDDGAQRARNGHLRGSRRGCPTAGERERGRRHLRRCHS